MTIKACIRKAMNSVLKRYDYEIINSNLLKNKWQKTPQIEPSYQHSSLPKGVNEYLQQKIPQIEPTHKHSDLPKGANEYLQMSNPILQDLQTRYDSFDNLVTTPLVWKDDHVKPEDILYFRGDNAYVWQLRGRNMNVPGYALATYYVKSIDRLGLLEKLTEDNLFGNYTFRIDNKLISRDLLDSILEIYFLENRIGLSEKKNITVLDIGAGYGRLAHRMTCALPNIKEYLCTDGVAISTFISEYNLRFRGLENRAKVIPLDEIENELCEKSVDIAINIHSFSECSISAIEWWLSLLEKIGIKYLMVVPNACNHGGKLLQTNDGKDMGIIIENHGYKLISKDPKYRDPIVQEIAVNPTYHYLFQFQKSNLE